MSCIRIITVDHYMSKPVSGFDPLYSHFRNSAVKEVPVIRIFGVTQSGEKACAHIHGAFPYVCIPLTCKEGLASFAYTMAEGLDSAINNSFGGGSRQHHVYKISEFSGIPFYGFHSSKQQFLKIEFYRPSIIKRAIQILQTGGVCGQKFQPHEAHLSYILQFFIDYNLYGMNFLKLLEIAHRTEPNNEVTSECHRAECLSKTTSCQVELDAKAEHILNKHEAENGNSLNPGLASIREEEQRRRMEDGLDQTSLSLSDSRSFEPTKSDIQFRNQFINGIKERKQMENDGLSQTSSVGTQHVAFDSEDASVLKVLFDRLVADNEVPDEDSILGSWSPHNEDNDKAMFEEIGHKEVEDDLSQPFVSFIELSDSEDEVIPTNQVNVKVERNSSSSGDEWQPLYVDGNADDPTTDGPVTRRQRTANQKSRYRPLDVKLYKSPRKEVTKKKISSPEIFRALEQNTSELRKIKSPRNNKTQSDLSNTCSSTSFNVDSTFTVKEEGRITRLRARRNLFNTSKTNDKEANTTAVKKVLFEVNDDTQQSASKKRCNDLSNKKTSTVSVLSNRSVEENIPTEEPNQCSNSSDLPSVGTNKELKILENSSNVITDSEGSLSPIPSGTASTIDPLTNQTITTGHISCDSNDSCTTVLWSDINATQNSIASFYGDTTMAAVGDTDYRILTPAVDAPSSSEVEETMTMFNIDKAKPIEPFYSDPCDGTSSKEIGFTIVSLKSKFPPYLEEFTGDFGNVLDRFATYSNGEMSSSHSVILQPAIDPPLPSEILSICDDKCESVDSSIIPLTAEDESSSEIMDSQGSPKPRNRRLTQVMREKRQSGEIDLATPNNSGQFKMEFQNLQEVHMSSLYRYTTLMVLEIHVGTRGELCPDPEYDAVQAIFYLVMNDVPPDSDLPTRLVGAVIVSDTACNGIPYDCNMKMVGSEKELFTSLLDLVNCHDPDIIAGYEIEMQSWGYLIQRGYSLGFNLLVDLSRVKIQKTGQAPPQPSGQTLENDYNLRLPGRIVLNVWRIMRHEVALLSYSFESLVYHVLHTRVPKFSYKTLTGWWNHGSLKFRHLVIQHYLTMVDGTERLLDQLDLVRRTSELASLFGIQFYEVFSRGSQFRVESMMLRLAKRLGFVAVSPSVDQRAHMMAPQSLPLIMEPESRFYGDPVIVLDFQSLYPSMMIAYNYCFSTCLGRLADLVASDELKFGCTSLKTNLKELFKLQNHIHVSPAGIVFVDKSIRNGVLPQMLQEILDTRLMVKASMKRHKDKKLLTRALDARQLGLKLIANVTYGYTSANFSGRMPCIEVGDSVVSKGRETLERAIRLVEETGEWRARVVYGDTDSLFVLCPGRSKEEAFIIGQQIAERVTNDNPPPVKLKLEKIFLPCILQTKKRYVGYMYESADQETPVYLAKGIETVRRDGCPAASKILEKSLKLLFDQGDMSTVRQFVRQQLTKVLSGRLSPSELSFAKEYRGISGYHPSAPVPALKIARELLSRDRRAEPRRSERVPYVVVCGPPGLPLISLVRHLPAYLADCAQLVLNADYYITKAILPPLERCLSLVGADVFSWYSSLPKKQLFRGQQPKGSCVVRKATISQYFATVNCVVCSRVTPLGLCVSCQDDPHLAIAHLSRNIYNLERKVFMLDKICQSCCSRSYETDCISLDCPILFRRVQATNDKMQTTNLRHIMDNLISELSFG
ncbi:DNA polymerase zeta catalytic subunit isoform X2 [Halyomorpha halys]|uniref:DNA polymerase zeta catalytic subunit isoform X2 n=1 Tax=Halyomorpha halys TaxID=286706 RepID=UPI0006D4F5DD|nr:DNA polymerase zeta catalytic subunit isoform X2 [Halyomorpha halys]